MGIFDDIKAKLDIVQVVSQYVKLKKAGRNFKGLCPFHNEQTPSFMVSPEKQIAYCFGCHKGGDVFKFTAEVEGLDTHEVVEFLADKAGVDTSKYDTRRTKVSPEKRAERKQQKERVQDVCASCANFYEKQLWETDSGEKVLNYLRGRGLTDETIKEFQIGFAPDSYEATYKHLVSSGSTKDDIVVSGQASVKSTDSSQVFDRFRLRLMFPIHDKYGKVVGFGGRKLKKEDEPKYLNSPDTPVYNKSHVLYGWDKAKEVVRKEDQVIFAEGYFDVIAAHQAGFKNVVATSGTALTDEQVKFVKRYTKNVLFVFDSDKAGRAATLRAVELAVKNGVKPSIISLGTFKDPDEACKAGEFASFVEGSQYYLDYYLDDIAGHIEHEGKSLTAGEKLSVCENFFQILQFSTEEIEVRHYLEKLSFTLRIELQNMLDSFGRFKKEQNRHRYKAKEEQSPAPKKREFAPVDYLFGFLIAFPETISAVQNILTENDFTTDVKNVYKELIAHYNGTALDTVAFFAVMDEGMSEALKVVSLFTETQYGSRFTKEELSAEAIVIAKRVKKILERNLTRELKFQMKEARSKGDTTEEEQFFKKYSDLIQRR